MSAENFFKSPGDVSPTLAPTLPGQGVSGRVVNALNSAPEAAQVSTIALPADADVSGDYTVTVNDTTVTVDGEGSTQDALGAAIVAALSSEGAVARRVTPTYASGTVTLTSRFVALAFTLAATGANLGAVATPTEAADAEDIGPGLLLIGDGSHTDGTPNVGLPLATTDIDDDFIGFSVRSDRMTNATLDGDDPVYAAGVGLPMQKDGEIAVEADLNPGNAIWVGTAAGERGLLFGAAGTGRLVVSEERLICTRRISSDLALVRIRWTAR